jgi:galactose mutarotase-like enzyme
LRHFGVRVTDRYRLDDLRTVIIENELLRVTFLVDQGSDIIEFLYKPKDIDFLWRAPLASRRRRPFVPASPIHRPFLDHYAGGWQELFPHAGLGTTYLKADLGFHGEVWGLPWEHQIVKDQVEEVAVRFWVRTVRMPFYLEKTVSLRTEESILGFHEVVVNEGKAPLQFMWGHHPAFGPPFLDRHCVLDAPASSVQIGEDILPWPVDSKGRDHSRLVPEESTGEVMK